MTPPARGRIATLDIVRGVAVMGILAMNIIGFALPDQSYLNASAYGAESSADRVSWAVGFILFDGKMRGLFSFLFGASLLLVIERARARGEDEGQVHFRRMLWLLLFGYLHFYLVWYGDILTGYATLGMAAWFFRDRPPEKLIGLGIAVTAVQFILFAFLTMTFFRASAAAAAPGAGAATVRGWAEMSRSFAVPAPGELARMMTLYRSDWATITVDKLSHRTLEPLIMLGFFGWELFANLLFGMALLKNGFLTGEWDDAHYRRAALGGFVVAVPAYAILATVQWSSGFAVPTIMLAMTIAVLVRPPMVVAMAALIILATRRGGWLVDRIAAAGRAAFSNYLGASIAMTAIFYGWGLGEFGRFGRAELWLFVLPAWLVMLAWSKPWLDRFAYGPFEWLWRSLARWSPQPMLRRVALRP